MKKSTKVNQVINVGPLPDGAGRQEVYINPPGAASSPPHYAAGTSHLVVLVAVAAFLVIIACGVAFALAAGAIW